MKENRFQKKTKRTRERLQKAALDIFSEKSIDAATVEEITEKADVGKGTLYQHFEDKEEIVITLVEEAVEHLIERLGPPDCGSETLEGMLEHLLNAHYGFSAEAKEEFILLFQGKVLLKLRSGDLGELREPYLRYLREIESRLLKYLSAETDPVKIRGLACAVAGFVFGFLSFASIGMSSDEIEACIKPVRQVFVRSLCTLLGR